MKALKIITLSVVVAASLVAGLAFGLGQGKDSLKALVLGEHYEHRLVTSVEIRDMSEKGEKIELISKKNMLNGEKAMFTYHVSNEDSHKYLSPSELSKFTFNRDFSTTICGLFSESDFRNLNLEHKCITAY